MASKTSRYESGGGRASNRYSGGGSTTSRYGTSKSNSYDVRKQVSNYERRLGKNAKNATDKRNWLEKKLNLKQDQNVLFDIFELLGRPQQALFGAIDAKQKGKDAGKAAWKGFTGKKEVSGKDLLKNAGMKDRKGKLDVSDVLGFGLDVFADPMDIPLVPVSAVSKAGKAIDTATDIAKGVDKATDVAKTAKRLASPSELVFRGAGKGIKKAAGLTDRGIEKVLGKIDAKQLRNAERAAEKTGQTVEDVLSQIGGKSDLLGDYKALKKGISNTIDSSKMVGGLTGKARRSANSVDTADAIARKIESNLENLSNNTAKKLNIDPNKLSEDITKILESEQKTSVDGLKWLNKLGKDNNVFEGTEKSVNRLKSFIQQYAPSIKFKQSSTPTKLVIDTTKSKYLEDFKANKDIRDAITKLGLKKDLGYTADEYKYIKNLKDTFANNEDLTKVLEEHRKGYPAIADAYKEHAGVDFDFARKEGWVRKAQGDLQREASDVLRSDITGNIKGQGLVNEKTFGTRKYDSGLVANRLKKEKLAEQLGGEIGEDGTISVGKLEKRQQNLEAKLSENRKATLEATRKEVSASLEKAKNFNINATKLGEREGEISASIKNTRNTLINTQEKLNNSTLKRIENIKDASLNKSKTALKSRFSKHTQDLSKYTKEYNNIIEKLSQKGLSDVELRKLTTKSESLQKQIYKVNAQLDGDFTVLNNFVNKKALTQINQTNNALKKTEGLGAKGQRLSDALSKNLDKQNILKQSNADTITALENRLKDIDLQLGALTPERDAEYLKEIEKLQNKISILSSNEGKELFNLNYHAGMKDFIDNATQYAKGAKVYNDALVYGTFKNPEYIRVFDEFAKDEAGNILKDEVGNLIKNEVPRGYVKIDGSKLQQQFDAIKGILPENSDALQMLGKEFAGKKLLVDKDFANLININRSSKEQANALVKVIDGFNNMFKKYKILTPGFQVRNIAGNATNMVLSGMPAGRIPEYYAKAGSVLNSVDDLLDKAARGVKLTGKDVDKWKILQQFYEGGFDKAGTKIQDLEQLRNMVKNKKGPLNKAADINAKLNESMDGLNRMALLMYANDHPKYIQKLGKSNAIEAVKYALMDPSNMSDFERSTIKKIIPFYTFTKQNLLFQATNMMKNTPRYNRLMKAIRSTYNNLGENEYFQYQKEGMQIPLPAKDKKGNRLFLKTNLPLSDLGEFMSNPLRRTLSSTTPLIKTPYEMVTGKDIYTGNDTYKNAFNDFSQATTGKGLSESGKKWATRAEQILSGLGVDTITTNNVKKISSILKKHNGDMDNQAMWAEVFRSVLQNTNQDKIEESRAYENLEAYQNYIKALKNQGIEVPTIRELNRQSKRTLRSVRNRRSSRY